MLGLRLGLILGLELIFKLEFRLRVGHRLYSGLGFVLGLLGLLFNIGIDLALGSGLC